MTQTDSKHLAIQCGKLRMKRLLSINVSSFGLFYCKQSYVKMKLNMLYTYVLRRISF
jgi:hypothetical protein